MHDSVPADKWVVVARRLSQERSPRADARADVIAVACAPADDAVEAQAAQVAAAARRRNAA